MSNEANPVLLSDIHLARAAVRDRVAAERMLTRVFPKIYQVLSSVVPHRGFVEDISQTVAVEVLRSLGNFRGQGTLEAWAGQIAFRTAMRYMKRHRDLERISVALDEIEISSGQIPERAAAKREVSLCLQRHLEEIPQMRRIPLLLHLVYGYTVSEVSELVGAPINTVKDRLKTAVRELRVLLDENPELKLAVLEVIS